MKEIVLDIETVGSKIEDYGLHHTIETYLKAKFGRQRKAKTEEDWTVFDTDLAEIVCISLYMDDTMYSFTQKDYRESEILNMFWDTIKTKTKHPYRIVTYNGKSYDIPIIIKKSAMYGITPTRTISTKKYDEREHCDLFGMLSGYMPSNAKSLNFYCSLYGIDKCMDTTGGDISGLVKQGKWDDVAEKCEDDVMATYELYNRLKAFI